MGTSSSSKGPKGGVPLVPPWVPDADPSDSSPDASQIDQNADASESSAVPAAPVAPPQRFTQVRKSLGKFAKGASGGGALRQSLKNYVRSYGASEGATRRFGGTAQTAGSLYGALSPNERGRTTLLGGTLDTAVLSGRSANDVMDAIVEAVQPTNGTQDAEAGRDAIKEALSELLTKYPDAALLDLTETQRLYAVELYVALDVYNRFMLDVGKAIQDKAPTVSAEVARLKEVKDYIKETVAAAFRKIGVATSLTRGKIITLAKDALKETFIVFESYAK